MKQQLLAISLLASAGLIADDGMNREAPRTTNNSGYCSTCCCTPCCCKPCCTPQPTECVSGVAYTVPFYDLQCDWGAFIDVEFLYWYARETDLSYAAVVSTQVNAPGSTDTLLGATRFKALDAKWDPGFRVGLGWNSECDGWDIYLNYTWMRNKKTTSTSVPTFTNATDPTQPALGESALMNPWINQSFGFDDGSLVVFNKIAAKWRLQWNVVDLEIGRKYWLSPCFNLRPYAGLRGAWWKTRFRTTSTFSNEVDAGVTLDSTLKDRFTNKAWGVGVIGGLQPTWYLSCCFALYANFDVALLWGELEQKKRERALNTFSDVAEPATDWSNRFRYCFSQMTPVLDAGLGIRWEDTWCCDRYRTALDLGWEHHIYFDQNHRMKSLDHANDGSDAIKGFRTYASEAGNIGLGGFVLRVRFDF